ncbi:hypothetical protein [Thiothrix subterranea]|uniref:Uncharacterized protein n=1 Tax=Thiothrix subterranea TaxID=2735563 RepID=A0AA51QXD3_9GAMM|nr:hypothetical protein [Thiothrix subterranea]MDQ5769560.1 hypothetical protein [Thiothrix subterranea]WML87143.1 hypothetical protein RCG00_02020 [Thiothrix subterranea]
MGSDTATTKEPGKFPAFLCLPFLNANKTGIFPYLHQSSANLVQSDAVDLPLKHKRRGVCVGFAVHLFVVH